MHQKLIKFAIFLMALHAPNVMSQSNDLTHLTHDKIDHFRSGYTREEDLEETKKTFASYPKEQVSKALVADIDIDRGNEPANHSRDVAALQLYRTLDLPISYIFKELEKDQPARRKVSLITLLVGRNTPDVTAALVEQFKDRRPAVEFIGEDDIPTHALRVCDVACNILYQNSAPDQPGSRIGYDSSYITRDNVIRRILKELKLDKQQ